MEKDTIHLLQSLKCNKIVKTIKIASFVRAEFTICVHFTGLTQFMRSHELEISRYF